MPTKKPAASQAPRRRGRPSWTPTPQDIVFIRTYAGMGGTVAQIAAILGKSEDTLRKHAKVREALATTREEIILQVSGNLVRKALDGNLSAMIFYLKTQAGWKETSVQEHTGPNGGPMITAEMSAKEAAELYRAELG